MKLLKSISIIFILLIFFFLFVKPFYILKQNSDNIDKSLLINRDCLEEIGKKVCEDNLKFIYIDEFNYKGTFNCFDESQFNITQEQLKLCSK